MGAAFPQTAVEPHQCMLVEMSGGGLHFTRSSVVRNMDFILNSKVTRSAEISVVGLKPISKGWRDVYLAVETLNMPERANVDLGVFGPVLASNLTQTVDRDRRNPLGTGDKVAAARAIIEKNYNREKQNKPEQRLAVMLDALRQVGATTKDLDVIFPTYRVHVYYDTGDTWKVDGVTYPLLALLPSFGYYGYHEGRLSGFNHQLRGATRVARNFYVLRVPNNGTAKITNVIHGISPGEERLLEKDEPIRDWPKKDESSRSMLDMIRRLFGINRG
jgi:hypothetical protein